MEIKVLCTTVFLFVVIVVITPCFGAPYRICYFPYEGNSSTVLVPSKLNATLCTHILFAFAIIKNATLVPGSSRDFEGYRTLTGLKVASPNLKVILSISTGPHYSFPNLVSTNETRAKFIPQSVKFLRKYHFDGIDFDWEFPGIPPSGSPANQSLFVEFLTEMKKAVEEEATRTKLPKLTLSAAVGSTDPIMIFSYDIPKLADCLDFINIMCYDYHPYHDLFPFTGHNSPLFRRSQELGYLSTLNIEWTAKAWERRGAPKNKLVIGLPIYGHTFRLINLHKKGVNAPASGFTFGASEVSYPVICKLLASGATKVFDKEARSPYLYKDMDWVSYDDVSSLTEKVKWVKDNGYLGVMTWSLMDDDWQGKCSPGETFPLHTAIYNALH